MVKLLLSLVSGFTEKRSEGNAANAAVQDIFRCYTQVMFTPVAFIVVEGKRNKKASCKNRLLYYWSRS